MKNILFAITLLLLLLQTGCKDASGAAPGLAGYEWRLVKVYGKTVPDSIKATLFLLPSEPVCKGSGGCNTYGCTYTLEDDRLQFANLVATEMACTGIMGWETDFFDALLQTQQFQIEKGKLKLLHNIAVLAELE